MKRSGFPALLAGSDRRSIGRSPVAVRRILRTPSLLPSLLDGLTANDPVIRMRTADAVEKLAHHRPDLIRRHALRLLRVAQRAEQQEVQWHLAQLLPVLTLSAAQRDRARRILRRYLASPSAIVQAMALDALVRLAPATRAGQAQARGLLDRADGSALPAVRARARRLRAELRRQAPTGRA